MKLNNNDDSHNSGLNLLIYNMLLDIESHPAWVCGLKLLKRAPSSSLSLSHPAWVCGLKHQPICRLQPSGCVTPCVGVWIETKIIFSTFFRRNVTPCVGVWIETRINRGRCGTYQVTPCVGVWIETFRTAKDYAFHSSHPAWVCGLKPL